MSQVAHFHYDYTPGGQVSRMTQNSAQTTTYGYDGADQLVSEVHAGDSVAYSLGFSYDHSGNRLTQTRGGSVVQSFAYDGHDKLLSGNASGETYSYDANGNQTGLNYYGSFYTFAFDDEDRLTGVTGSNGLNDAFLYNGLGQRTAKTDSTGQYALVSDGAAPAAPVLADGVTVYTPGLSSRKNGSSEFRHGDLLGSLRFLTDANQTVVGDRLFSAFGATVASDGDPSTPFGWVGDGESQTDADTGLVLMGHRVYDSRLGRFLSQDPIHAGSNWYSYVNNNPVNGTDPLGLLAKPFPEKGDVPLNQIIQDTAANGGLPGETYNVTQGGKIVNTFTIPEQIGFTHIIAGYNVSSIFADARAYANATLIGRGGETRSPNFGEKLVYLYAHFHTGSAGDPKSKLVGLGSNPLYSAYDNTGNYGFGAAVAGLLLPVPVGKVGAGILQSYQAYALHGVDGFMNNTLNNGFFTAGSPYGDDPISQKMIQNGYQDYSHR